jgi:hypothetical protein
MSEPESAQNPFLDEPSFQPIKTPENISPNKSPQKQEEEEEKVFVEQDSAEHELQQIKLPKAFFEAIKDKGDLE